MKHLCTQNDLVRYLYRETSTDENRAIEEKMERNWNYKESFQELRDAMFTLPKVRYSPDPKTVKQILGISRRKLCEPQLN